MQLFKILIVDDELDACVNIHHFLTKHFDSQIQILDYSHDLTTAIQRISQAKPDLVFFDISLQNDNAMDFLELQRKIDFEIIFITAFSQYACRAFRLNAIDYLLKPIQEKDFVEAVKKLLAKLSQLPKSNANIIGHKELLRFPLEKTDYKNIILKENDRYIILPLSDIIYIESIHGYSHFHLQQSINTEKGITSSYTLAHYEEIIPVDMFYRIHKTYIINTTKLRRITKTQNPEVLLCNGKSLPIGRRRLQGFLEYMKQ